MALFLAAHLYVTQSVHCTKRVHIFETLLMLLMGRVALLLYLWGRLFQAGQFKYRLFDTESIQVLE